MKRLALAFLLPVAIGAQPLDDGTYDVYQQDLTREGKLEGCSLVFTGIVSDTAYLKGQQVMLNGSIALRTFGRADLFFTGKLGTRPMLPSGLPAGPWQEPVHFHFASKNGTTAGANIQVMDAETPGYRLLLGRATDGGILKLVMDLADSGEFIVGFNRKSGGQDVRLPIKINVALKKDAAGLTARVRNDETAHAFTDCTNRLLNDVTSRIERK